MADCKPHIIGYAVIPRSLSVRPCKNDRTGRRSFPVGDGIFYIFQGQTVTLQGINISHLGKRKIIFKIGFSVDMLVPRRVNS